MDDVDTGDQEMNVVSTGERVASIDSEKEWLMSVSKKEWTASIVYLGITIRGIRYPKGPRIVNSLEAKAMKAIVCPYSANIAYP
ncbi:hypothetical protein U1Q18_002307 [Sarracenia purpurea var. burkii]